MSRRLLRYLLKGPEPDDIQPRDFVRKYGFKGTGCVESVTNDHALVNWLDGSKEIVACKLLRMIQHRGGRFDSRWRGK